MADWKLRIEQFVIGVATNWVAPLILAALALLWNWGSQGGLIRVLGGVTQKEFGEAISRVVIPKDGIIAFDGIAGCPQGWTIEKRLVGAIIAGADPTPKGYDPTVKGYDFSPDFIPDPAGSRYYDDQLVIIAPSASKTRAKGSSLSGSGGYQLVPLWYCRQEVK